MIRKIDIKVLASTLFVSATAFSNSAYATDTASAISICTARGAACTINSKADGGYHICVNNGGVTQCVDCPPLMSGGSCTVSTAKKGGKTIGTVEGVLQPGPAKAK
jgi:hypothetical protein